jgi:chromosomal replication initiator protein
LSDEVHELWNQTVSYINQRSNAEQSQICSFLDYLAPEALSDSELVVSTNNRFAKGWIEKNYYKDIKDALFNVIGIDFNFRIVISDKEDSSDSVVERSKNNVVDADISVPSSNTFPTYHAYPSSVAQVYPYNENIVDYQETPQKTTQTEFFAPTNIPSVGAADPVVIKGESTSGFIGAQRKPLSDERTFESFIVGDSNRYAFSAALGVAKSPGNIYNPLFIYGDSGLGKTHLLLAIENYIREHQPYLKTTYAQTSDFVRDFTQMLYNDEKRREFEQQYRMVDVILLDDVQYLEGKVETTGEVFQIFNDFTTQNKQIILSADRAPNSIQLDERYKSRFASGITIDIQPPNFETKHAIFENYLDFCCRKLEKIEIKDFFSQDIVDKIIELSSDNIRELEGATASLVAYLSERQKQKRFDSLTMEEVEKCISNVFMRTAEKRVNISIIQKEIERFYHISHDDLIGKKRSQGITYPRQVAMYLSRSMTSESYPDIGKAFGGKDHTSVMYACNNIEQKRQLSKTVENEIKSLVDLIKK